MLIGKFQGIITVTMAVMGYSNGSALRNRKILVTGGCGFIGSNFIRYLLEADPQVAIVNFDALTYAGNLANLAPVAGSPPNMGEKMLATPCPINSTLGL